jgi:hypothetical protein
MKAFFQKNWIHFAAVAAMFVIVAIFFKPVFEGFLVKQHDAVQWKGMAQELLSFNEKTGEKSLWTNSMFSGMPAMQITISMLYTGNILQKIIIFYYEAVPSPIGLVFLHMICFYFMAIMFRIRPIIAIIGAVAYSFASYEIIIIQAGHSAKSAAAAYLPLVLGLFVYAYRYKSWIAVALSGVIMSLDISANHVQVTYYMIFLLVFVGIYFLIKAYQEKTFKSFFVITIGLFIAYGLAGVVNSPNILLTNDYAKHTIRGGNEITIAPDGTDAMNQSKGLDRDYITNWSYGIGETFTLISPNVKGGGSFYIGGSQFESILENSDFSSSTKNSLMRSPAYWGDQPFTSGPVYIGVVVVFLSFLGLIFLKTGLKWPLFIMAVLAIGLSWGKNLMGLTDLFIDYIPGYSKFRTVTIVLIMVELTIPIIGVLFLEMLIKEKEQIRERKNVLLASVIGFFLFLLIVKIVGLGDGYMSAAEKEQVATIESLIINDLNSYDPEMLKAEINLDINNSEQVAQYVEQRKQAYSENFENVKSLRESIFNASMNRSLGFAFFAGALLLLFVFTAIHPFIFMGGMLLLVLIDILPVSNEYLGKQEEVNGSYKYWEDKWVHEYPFEAREADFQIMEMEVKSNPKLGELIDNAEKLAIEKADKKGVEGKGRLNMINSYRFSELNLSTNYRVFDRNGGFNSSYTSYFHKSFGGYHGAKLRNFNNLIEFHIAKGNNKVYDMLNVRYIIHDDEKGSFAQQNPQAMGNAWMVKRLEVYDSPNNEIRALGTRFKLVNEGVGQLFVNGQKTNEVTVYGSEKINYVINSDTLHVPLSNGMTEGMEAIFVMDRNQKTELVVPQVFENDTARTSFLKMVRIKTENEFKPAEEVVMTKEWAEKLSQKEYTGKGSVEMTSYKPNKITYNVKSEGKQLVVFSEIFYPKYWTATIDGKEVPIVKVNYLLRAIEVPDGNHEVVLNFDIPQYYTLNKIALTGCIILILGLILTVYFRYQRRRVINE